MDLGGAQCTEHRPGGLCTVRKPESSPDFPTDIRSFAELGSLSRGSMGENWAAFPLVPNSLPPFKHKCARLPEVALQTPENALQTPENALQTPENALQMPENALQMPENALQMPEIALQTPETALQMTEHALQMHV